MHGIVPADTHALILTERCMKDDSKRKKDLKVGHLFRDVLGVLLNFLDHRHINELAHVNRWFCKNIFKSTGSMSVLRPIEPLSKTVALFPLVLRQQIEAHQFSKPMNYIECKRLLNAYRHYNMRPFFPTICHLRLDADLVVIDNEELRTILSYFPCLLSLSIASKSVTNAGLEPIRACTFLERLDLTQCTEIGNEGLSHLSGLHTLESLSLIGCSKITDEGLQSLRDLKQLKHLSLAWCKNITDIGLIAISTLSLVQNLDCSWCEEIQDEGITALSNLSNLRNLQLDFCNKITDKGIVCLKNLRLLEVVSTHGCKRVTNQGRGQLHFVH